MTKRNSLIMAAILIFVDQVIKIQVVAHMVVGQRFPVIKGLFNITYIQNEGAAFGILQGKTGFLSVVVTIVLIAAIAALLSGRIKEKMLIAAVGLIIAGGAGNLIDRVSRGYVVDYLDFSALFGFPVFNFADCCVVVGTFLILFYILFLERKQQAGTGESRKSAPSGLSQNKEEDIGAENTADEISNPQEAPKEA